MSKKHHQPISLETETEAMKIARATQRPKQTKEQTKLIAQGIEKGIAQYKKLQKIKQRAQDKQRKQTVKKIEPSALIEDESKDNCSRLPWVLLAITWSGMMIYFAINELF